MKLDSILRLHQINETFSTGSSCDRKPEPDQRSVLHNLSTLKFSLFALLRLECGRNTALKHLLQAPDREKQIKAE